MTEPFVQSVSRWMGQHLSRQGRRPMPRRTSRGNRTRLEFLSLENRVTPAGSVRAQMVPPTGLLLIQETGGPGGNPCITIAPSPESSLNLRVAGDAGTFTSVNGVPYVDFDLSSIHSIRVEMNDGDDSVNVQDLNDPNPLHHTALTGNLDVVMGSGKDTFNAQRVKANQVNFDEPGKTTAGGDTVSFYQVQAGSSNILTGPAADSVTLDQVRIGTATINTGSDVRVDGDTVKIIDQSTIGRLTINSGSSGSAITVRNTLMSLLTIHEGDYGSVTLSDGDVVRGDASISVGNNSTSISLDPLRVQGNLSITAGDDSQEIQLTNVDVRGGLDLKVAGIYRDMELGIPGDLTFDSVSVGGSAHVYVGGFSHYYLDPSVPTVNLTNVSAVGDLVLSLGTGSGGDFSFTGEHASAGGNLAVTVGEGDHSIAASDFAAGYDMVFAADDGSNTIAASSLSAGHDFALSTDDGTNAITLSDLGVGHDFNLATADEFDSDDGPITIGITNLTVGNDFALTTGTGSDTITLTSLTVGNDFALNSSEGSDTITITNLTVGQNLAFHTGDGDNTIVLTNITVTNELEIALGTGANGLSAQDVTCAFGTIDGGGNSASVYQDLGGNSGFDATDFGSYIF